MRRFWVGVAALVLAASSAQAKVSITVDKDNQQMTVAVDGVERYNWPVSTGNPSHETPSGKFQTFRMEEDHFSKEFDDAPMPHAIFFTRQGHAIHGTDSVSRLGSPASHGCVRLSRANASTLWDLVKAEGVLNTSVSLTGSSQVALARNPRPARNAVARRNAAPDYDGTAPQSLDPQASLQPLQPGRQIAPRRIAPQLADDGYISPADGSGGRYPAPRGYRRGYDAQGNAVYYGDRGSQAQGYGAQLYGDQNYGGQVYAPRQQYYQQGW